MSALLISWAAISSAWPSQSATVPPTPSLLEQFKCERGFWQQFEIGLKLAEIGDRTAIRELEPLLVSEDRHLRGNVAFVLARLGDPRGFTTIAAMLEDRSPRPPVEGLGGLAGEPPSSGRQIREDRYYAAHLLGDLRDPRAVPLLIPLLTDPDVRWVVPWSLGQIGDPSAIPPLIQVLNQYNPDMRIFAMSALVQLKAKEALPTLRELLADDRRSTVGNPITVVGEAANRAIAAISGR